MPKESRPYIAYMLRLWQTEEGGHLCWRASLESPNTGVRRGFVEPQQLFAFLQSQMNAAVPNVEADSNDLLNQSDLD